MILNSNNRASSYSQSSVTFYKETITKLSSNYQPDKSLTDKLFVMVLQPVFFTLTLSAPLLFLEMLPLWQEAHESRGIQLISRVASAFLLMGDGHILSSLNAIIIERLFLIGIDCLVIYRLWIFGGFSSSSNKALSMTLLRLIGMKYCFLNNHFLIELSKVFICRVDKTGNYFILDSSASCTDYRYSFVVILTILAIAFQLTLNILLTSMSFQTSVSKNRMFSK